MKELVVAISGSLRRGSYTRAALEIALRGAEENGATGQLIDLRQYQLPFCDGKEDEGAFPADVFRLRKEVAAAAGIILGTPEYHGGVSGVLKNALDLMGFDELKGKTIGLIGVSGGGFGAVHALHHLRGIARSVHAWVIPEEAWVPEAYKAFDASGKLRDPALEERLKIVGRQVARFARLRAYEQRERPTTIDLSA